MKPLRCEYYKPKNIADKCNCANCQKWTGKKCKDEAELLAEWHKRYSAYEHMMRENKGVVVDGE